MEPETLPGWDLSTGAVGLIFGLVVWGWMAWWASRTLVSSQPRADFGFERHTLIRWFWVAAILKVTIIVVWYLSVGGYEINPSVGDSEGYDDFGWMLAQDFREGKLLLFSLPPYLQDSYPGFYYWVGLLYVFFGHHPILVSLFNVLLSLWMGVLIYQVSLALFDSRTAKYALVVTLFYPHWISASYLLLKDLTIAFIVTLALWAIYAPRRFGARAIAFAVSVVFLSAFRAPLGVLLGALGILQFSLLETKVEGRYKTIALGLLLIVFVVFGSAPRWGGIPLFERGYTTGAGPEDVGLGGTRFTFSWEGFLGLGTVIAGNPALFLQYAAATTIRFFYGPFFLFGQEGPNLHPYHPDETPFRALLESSGGIFTGLIMPMIAMGWFHCMRRRGRDTLMLSAWLTSGILILVYAGLLVRWRLPFIVVALMFAGIGFSWLDKIRSLYWGYIVLYVLLIGANATVEQGFLLPKASGLALAVLLAWSFLAGRRRQFLSGHG